MDINELSGTTNLNASNLIDNLINTDNTIRFITINILDVVILIIIVTYLFWDQTCKIKYQSKTIDNIKIKF